jgi:Flp pilus assembly protein TadG
MNRRRLLRDARGVAAVEMGLALPVLILFIFGITQVGMIMAADAGMQHALGEGARVATLYPTPSDTVIKGKISDKLFGTLVGSHVVADPVTNSVSRTVPGKNGAAATTVTTSLSKDLAITYTVTPNFLFFNGPPITLNRTKRVYLSF